jgi:hypothetical protein
LKNIPHPVCQAKAHAWVQLPLQQAGLTTTQMMMQLDDSDDLDAEASFGTYDGSEEMQAALSDDDHVTLASHYLSEFSLSSDNPHDRTTSDDIWHFTGIGENGEQVGDPICIAHWLGESTQRDRQQGTKGEWSPVCRDQEHTRAMQAAEWSPICRDQEHNHAMQDADQAQKQRASSAAKGRSVHQKKVFSQRVGRFQRFQTTLRNRSSSNGHVKVASFTHPELSSDAFCRKIGLLGGGQDQLQINQISRIDEQTQSKDVVDERAIVRVKNHRMFCSLHSPPGRKKQ